VWGRGQWDGEAAWSLSDLGGEARAEVEDMDIQAIESLAAGICPVCGKELTWGEALPIGLLAMVDKQPLGAGYYRLADNKSPPLVAENVKMRLYWLELIKRAKVNRTIEGVESRTKAEAGEYQGWWHSVINSN
ncbi:unnamed protein product, partial [marine sediment metagenome]